jgi:hypothetical protein
MRRYIAVAALLMVFIGLSCGRYASAEVSRTADARPVTTSAKAPAVPARAEPRATPVRRNTAESAQQALTAAVAPLIRKDGGHVAVAVDDLTTGARASYGGSDEFVTASIVKVDILATLLYQLHQSGQALTAEDQWLATTMIENSDNDSASDLYDDVGGADGIDAANRVFGLTQTTVGTDGYWGLTSTTVQDQIQLLRQVFLRPSALSPASQDYIQNLMGSVEADQRWGVPAAADAGTGFMVKNGWLPNPTLWEINSIGEIVHGHQRMLVTVLSADNASENSGIAVVQAVAKAAATSVAAGSARLRPAVSVALVQGAAVVGQHAEQQPGRVAHHLPGMHAPHPLGAELRKPRHLGVQVIGVDVQVHPGGPLVQALGQQPEVVTGQGRAVVLGKGERRQFLAECPLPERHLALMVAGRNVDDDLVQAAEVRHRANGTSGPWEREQVGFDPVTTGLGARQGG